MENLINRIYATSIVVCVTFLMSGCAHAPVSSATATAPLNGMARVVSEDPALRITHVDGEKTASFFGFFMHGFAKDVDLAPGSHQVTLWYGDPNRPCRSGYSYTVNAEAGDVFIVKDAEHRFDKCTAFAAWVEGNHHGTMQLSSSSHEPVSEKTLRLEQSPFFKWEPPQNEDWIIEYRNSRAAALGRSGSHPDETYAIYMQAIDISTFRNEQEFVDMVRKARKRNSPDSVRFSDLEEKVEPYSGRSDFCASFQHVSEDHNPGGTLSLHKSMILESYGYVCRIPSNKNVVLHFEYSQRANTGDSDKNLKQKADESFAKLEF